MARRRSFKKETAIDRHGSRKFRPYPADTTRRPKARKRSKIWVGGHRRGRSNVRGHFRKASHKHLF